MANTSLTSSDENVNEMDRIKKRRNRHPLPGSFGQFMLQKPTGHIHIIEVCRLEEAHKNLHANEGKYFLLFLKSPINFLHLRGQKWKSMFVSW